MFGKMKLSYSRLHAVMRARIPIPNSCPKCNSSKRLDICNISGKYLLDVSDWEYMCRRCHITGDGRLSEIEKYLKLGRRPGWNHSEKTKNRIRELKIARDSCHG